MTIRIEQTALLSVLSNPPTWPSIRSEDDGEFVVLNLPEKSSCEDAELSRWSSYCDDTISTTSETLSTDDSIQRRVSFAPSIVTDEWTRPFTSREDIPFLFYSNEDTNRFRQEYRLERKVLSELSIDPDAFPLENDELSDLVSKTASSHSPQGRHNISRVVVLHNNKLETFVTPSDVVEHEEPLSSDFFDNDSFWSGSLTWY